MNPTSTKDELKTDVVSPGERIPCSINDIIHSENEGRSLRIWYIGKRTTEEE